MPDKGNKLKEKRRQQQAKPVRTTLEVPEPERITYGRGEPRGRNIVHHGKGHDRHDR